MSDCVHRRDPDTCEMCLWDEFDRAPDDATGVHLAERIIANAVPLLAISDAQERVDQERPSLGVRTETRPYVPATAEDAAKVRDILQRRPALLGPPPALQNQVRRTPEEQRQFDVDALIRIIEQQAGFPRRNLERCRKCDAYQIRGKSCVMCHAGPTVVG